VLCHIHLVADNLQILPVGEVAWHACEHPVHTVHQPDRVNDVGRIERLLYGAARVAKVVAAQCGGLRCDSRCESQADGCVCASSQQQRISKQVQDNSCVVRICCM
jgi:hypothetical protein